MTSLKHSTKHNRAVNYCPTCKNSPSPDGMLDATELYELGLLDEWVICLNCGEALTLE